jgi:transcriptional regulator with XRE-family HTH domain
LSNRVTRQIKAEIVLRGLTIPKIARRIGVSRSHLSLVINGHVKNDRTRVSLSKVLNLPLSIWEEMDKRKKIA